MSARGYADLVEHWLDTHKRVVEREERALEQATGAQSVGNPELRIVEALSVVRWYMHFICAKIVRAHCRDEAEEEFMEPAPDSDENGSAKIALIGMDRSIAAWSLIRAGLGDECGLGARCLGHLIELRRATESAFPLARQFVRPGFDELPGSGRGEKPSE